MQNDIKKFIGLANILENKHNKTNINTNQHIKSKYWSLYNTP